MNSYQKISVVIAEDEQLILENIVSKIEKSDEDFNVIGYAQNGEDALNIIKDKMPDILFTDIRMPVMDGLELIRQAKLVHPTIHIVILSGYDDFSYAQQAIKLGVFGYLLKPLRNDSLSETLTDLKAKIYENIRSMERNILIQDLNGINSTDVLPYAFKDNNLYLYLIGMGNLQHDSLNSVEKKYYRELWDLIEWKNIVLDCFANEERWWVVDEKTANEKFLICSYKGEIIDNKSVAKKIQNYVLDKIQYIMPVTVSTTEFPVVYSNIWDISHELRKLRANYQVVCGSSILINNILPITTPLNSLITDVIKNIIKKLLKQNEIDMLYIEISKLLQTWIEAKCTQQIFLEASSLLLKTSLEVLNEYDQTLDNTIINEISTTIAKARSKDELIDSLLKVFSKYLNPYKKITSSSQELFANLEEYINLNYLKPITVDTLAEKFNFSPHYIIRVFKKYKGEPPMQYLTSLRINEAKNLIKTNPDMDFKLISEIVGYPDPHYFSRIFKNITNLSPSEYRDRLKWEIK